MARIPLKEYFSFALVEGPHDTTFKPAPEVKPVASSSTEEDPAAASLGGAAAPEPAMTQDVAPMEPAQLSFFAQNAQSAVEKFSDLANEGFDTAALDQFAAAVDGLVAQMYQGVQDPAERQDFEVEAQKCAGDFAKDLAKLFDKVLKLRSYSQPY